MRPRQQRLLQEALPRLRLKISDAAAPSKAFETLLNPPLFLEIGFGGGEHALAQSIANPHAAYIASEVFENGLCALMSRLVCEGDEAHAEPLPNFRLWPDDARALLKAMPDASLERVYLMFPDPWPKARHAKRRFVHPENIALLARVMRPGATWRIASDHPIYQEWVTDVMATQPYFVQESFSQGVRPEDWSPTRYESKALREGRVPYYWTFRRHDA